MTAFVNRNAPAVLSVSDGSSVTSLNSEALTPKPSERVRLRCSGRFPIGRRNPPPGYSGQPGRKTGLFDDSESSRLQPALEVWYVCVSITQVEWTHFWKGNHWTRSGTQGIGHALGEKCETPRLKGRGTNFVNHGPAQDARDEDPRYPAILEKIPEQPGLVIRSSEGLVLTTRLLQINSSPAMKRSLR
jgi:hypothetical protein